MLTPFATIYLAFYEAEVGSTCPPWFNIETHLVGKLLLESFRTKAGLMGGFFVVQNQTWKNLEKKRRLQNLLMFVLLKVSWNPNDLYFWRSNPPNKALFNQNSRVIWVPGIQSWSVKNSLPCFFSFHKKLCEGTWFFKQEISPDDWW